MMNEWPEFSDYLKEMKKTVKWCLLELTRQSFILDVFRLCKSCSKLYLKLLSKIACIFTEHFNEMIRKFKLIIYLIVSNIVEFCFHSSYNTRTEITPSWLDKITPKQKRKDAAKKLLIFCLTWYISMMFVVNEILCWGF